MHTLIIEDDPLMARAIGFMLREAEFAFTVANTGESAIELARNQNYEAILLDLTLPDLHGYEVLRRLRVGRIATPVMVVTGNDELASKLAGFELGADDYVTKPFKRTELLARVQALVRRSAGKASALVTTGAMAVDLIARTVEVNGHRIDMTRKEFGILELLSLRKGLTLNKEMLMNHLYGGRDEPNFKIIDVMICKLRKKLAAAGTGALGNIETVWGRGYVLRDPEGEPATAMAAA